MRATAVHEALYDRFLTGPAPRSSPPVKPKRGCNQAPVRILSIILLMWPAQRPFVESTCRNNNDFFQRHVLTPFAKGYT